MFLETTERDSSYSSCFVREAQKPGGLENRKIGALHSAGLKSTLHLKNLMAQARFHPAWAWKGAAFDVSSAAARSPSRRADQGRQLDQSCR